MISIDKKTRDFILKHEDEDIKKLVFRASSFPDIDIYFAILQIAGRKSAKQKIPTWYECLDVIYPKHLSLEQSSSESTAQYKATLQKEGTLIDLTGGLGVDFSFMSRRMSLGTYIEAQTELVDLAKHNFTVLGMNNVQAILSDGVEYLRNSKEIYDTIYLDPARRSNTGKKTVLIQDCTPNLLEIDDLIDEKSNRGIIKLSPMLDIHHALQSLKNISQIHIISVNNECKELLLIKEKQPRDTEIFCVNILNNKKQDTFTFTYQQESTLNPSFSNSVLTYLYEPNSSIMKAGAYKSVSDQFNLKKLHPNSHLYTSESFIGNFPGRKFRVQTVFSPNRREIKQHLNSLNKANISTRNYPFSVAELRKQLKLGEGGNDYIFATTLIDERKVLILCEKIE